MNEEEKLFDDSDMKQVDSPLQGVLRELHARISRQDMAWMALAASGGLPKGFAAEFKSQYQTTMKRVASNAYREALEPLAGTWLDVFEAADQSE